MLTLSLDPVLLAQFPDLLVAGLVVERLDDVAGRVTTDDLAALWSAAREAVRERDIRLETVALRPEVAAWRQAFATTGVKPGTYRSSLEALVRRVLKEGSVATPLPIVTAYCALSVTHLATMGGYDLDRLPADEVAVRRALPETDHFNPLGGRAADMPLTPEVVVYACGSTVLCWSFNHRDSRDTSLVPATRRAVFFSEAVVASQYPCVEDGLAALADWLASRGAAVRPVVTVSRAVARRALL